MRNMHVGSYSKFPFELFDFELHSTGSNESRIYGWNSIESIEVVRTRTPRSGKEGRLNSSIRISNKWLSSYDEEYAKNETKCLNPVLQCCRVPKMSAGKWNF